MFIIQIENDDSSTENDDSSTENDDSSTENDDFVADELLFSIVFGSQQRTPRAVRTANYNINAICLAMF